jgi:hypothetical protein
LRDLLIGGISLAEIPAGVQIMKKNEFSELGSNMLIVGSVTLALEITCNGLYRRNPSTDYADFSVICVICG